jgi:GH35 family endo-1,4-beta-xylanase
MDACLCHPAVEMVVMWNVTDGDSWINRWNQGQRRSDGMLQRPLLFDGQGLPKPAFHAVATSLGEATVKFDPTNARTV